MLEEEEPLVWEAGCEAPCRESAPVLGLHARKLAQGVEGRYFLGNLAPAKHVRYQPMLISAT